MPTLDIEILRCKGEWRALLIDGDGGFASGKSKEEAIGRLVVMSARALGLNIQEIKSEKNKYGEQSFRKIRRH